MLTTDKWIFEQISCTENIQWLETQKDNSLLGHMLVATKFHLANWFLVSLMTLDQAISYALFAAKDVSDIYEAKYPGDLRIRNGFDAAKLNAITPDILADVQAAVIKAAETTDAAYQAYAKSTGDQALEVEGYLCDSASYAAKAIESLCLLIGGQDKTFAAHVVIAAPAATVYSVAASTYDVPTARAARKKKRIDAFSYGIEILDMDTEELKTTLAQLLAEDLPTPIDGQ